MMLRCRSREDARAIARERGLRYGWCAVDPWWYVGTLAELQALPVVVLED